MNLNSFVNELIDYFFHIYWNHVTFVREKYFKVKQQQQHQ